MRRCLKHEVEGCEECDRIASGRQLDYDAVPYLLVGILALCLTVLAVTFVEAILQVEDA